MRQKLFKELVTSIKQAGQIRRRQAQGPTLEVLLEGMTPDDCHPLDDVGPDVGLEIITEKKE